MRIAMIGTGYVGLVSGACLSEFGHQVVCVDKDAAKVAALHKGVIPIFEPGLDEVVAANVKAGRLSFETDLKRAVAGADAVFIAVGTPSRRGDGHADLSYVFAAAEEIAAALTGYAVVVTKSTVPVGTSRQVESIIKKIRADAQFDMASNPEFLREGSAIEDFRRPDRVVVGCDTDRDEHGLSTVECGLEIGGEAQTPGGRIGSNELVEAGLEDWHFTALQARDLFRVLVDAGDRHSELGEASPGDESDIPCADHRYTHLPAPS